MKNFLNLNYSITQWEVYKIYRIRNSIVHGGRGSDYSAEAVYFLEHYYILLLDDLLEKLSSEKFRNILDLEEYFSRIKRSYDNYYDILISEKITEDKYKLFVLPYFVL